MCRALREALAVSQVGKKDGGQDAVEVSRRLVVTTTKFKLCVICTSLLAHFCTAKWTSSVLDIRNLYHTRGSHKPIKRLRPDFKFDTPAAKNCANLIPACGPDSILDLGASAFC